MIRKIVATTSMMALAGGLVVGSSAPGFAQAPDGRMLLLACSRGCSGSQEHGMSHQETNQQETSRQGGDQHETTHPRLVQGQATSAPPAAGNQADARLASKAQELCPVLGAKVDRSVFTDHEGKRVYFCCPACISRFKEDPARYIQQMQSQGVTLERTSGN
jgi:YHS domain-containing protein